MAIPIVPCIIAGLWLLITFGTFIVLQQMQNDAGKRQGSSFQSILIKVYTATALLVAPITVTLILPYEALIIVALVACVGLACSETIPQVLGIASSMKYFVPQCLRSKGPGVDMKADTTQDPRLCILMAAYIPNETETLPRTLQQFLPIESGGKGIKVPPNTLILLTYNPSPSPAEQEVLNECAQIGAQIPGASFTSLLVPDSHTKAHNVNAGFAFLAQLPPGTRPDVICVMDADIDISEEDVVMKGCEGLRQAAPNVAVVSACTKVSIGSWLVAAEYAMKDVIMTLGYGRLISTGWFTGNFVFMRTHIALSYGFDEKCLVEDNELMMRLLRDGYFVDHRIDIAVYTEAPPRLMSFLTQRTRWAQGATFLTLQRIPEMVLNGSFVGMSVVRRMLLKLRLLIYGFIVRLLPKYIIPYLLPATTVLGWRCGRNPEVCEDFSTKMAIVSRFGLVYMIVSFTAQVVGASFKHPWARFYHYLAFVILRIPYGIFNAQAPVIADAQFLLKLDKWIVTDRHVSEPSIPSPNKIICSPSAGSTCSGTANLTTSLLDTSSNGHSPFPSNSSLSTCTKDATDCEAPSAPCGPIVAGAAGTYIQTH